MIVEFVCMCMCVVLVGIYPFKKVLILVGQIWQNTRLWDIWDGGGRAMRCDAMQ